MEMMLATVSMIGGGVLERFPNLQVGFLEGNCSWVPWLVWRLDEHFELSGRFEAPELKLEPQEYFKRQCFAVIEPEESSSATYSTRLPRVSSQTTMTVLLAPIDIAGLPLNPSAGVMIELLIWTEKFPDESYVSIV